MNSRFILHIILALSILFSCKTETFSEGERIYKAYCSNCHMDDGSGLAKLIPPIADSDYLKNHQSELPCIILHGQQGPIVVNGVQYDEVMPAAKLSDVQLLNLINYINNGWNNELGYTTITQVKERKAKCKNEPR